MLTHVLQPGRRREAGGRRRGPGASSTFSALAQQRIALAVLHIIAILYKCVISKISTLVFLSFYWISVCVFSFAEKAPRKMTEISEHL